jgi:hypothetical protein
MNSCCVDKYNLCINQGTTFTRVFFWRQSSCCGAVGSAPAPVNITGYAAAMQIRQYDLGPVVFDASADLVLGGPLGTITLTIAATDTENFTWWNGVYDLLMISPTGFVTRLVEGCVNVSPGVTA